MKVLMNASLHRDLYRYKGYFSGTEQECGEMVQKWAEEFYDYTDKGVISRKVLMPRDARDFYLWPIDQWGYISFHYED